MSTYDNNKDVYDEQPFRADRYARAGYRPGWIWIPVAVTGLLILLLIAMGFIYGDYSDRTRAYDNGTAIEQTIGDVTMPALATPFPNPNPPEEGAVGDPGRPLVLPEEAPPIPNDGL